MSYLSQRGHPAPIRPQKSHQHTQAQHAQCSGIPQYVCYQVSADGQAFRPVYLTAEAYESYLLGQEQDYQRRSERFNPIPDHHEAQKVMAPDDLQHAYPMQPVTYQFPSYYDHARIIPDERSQADYHLAAKREQVMSRRHTWNYDWNKVNESDYGQGPKMSQNSSSESLDVGSRHHSTLLRYASAAHPCGDMEEARTNGAFQVNGMIRSTAIYTPDGSQSLSPATIGIETTAITNFDEWSNNVEPLRNHSHVDPNSLSLTPKDTQKRRSLERFTVIGHESLPTGTDGRQRTVAKHESHGNAPRTCSSRLQPARRRSPSEHSESKASDDDGTILSEVDLGVEGRDTSAIPKTANAPIEDSQHSPTSLKARMVKGELDQTDSELEALQEDSDSDYTPIVESRPRRKVAASQHGLSAQPKRGRVPTKQKERLMLSSPECENAKAQQELCAGNVPVLGRYSPAPLEYSEDTDASTSGRSRKRKRCRRPGEVFKAFVCDVKNCDKRFRRSEHLRRHIRSLHTGEKPFRCEVCLKTFSRSDNLAQHMKVHRGVAKKAIVYPTAIATPASTTAASTRRRRLSPTRA